MTPTKGEVWLLKVRTLVRLPIPLKRRQLYRSEPEMSSFSPRHAAPWALLSPLGLLALLACSSSTAAPHAPAASARESEVTPTALELELNEDELRIARGLGDHTRAFRGHGERDAAHPWELLESVEYVSSVLEQQRVPVSRSTTERDGVIFHAFTVAVAGEDPSAPSWVLVASYDSLLPRLASREAGSAGESDRGALEAAFWLELVRQMGQARLKRGVRFVLLARPTSESQEALTELLGETSSAGVVYLGGGLGARQLGLSTRGDEEGLLSALEEELNSVEPEPPLARSVLALQQAALSQLAQVSENQEKFPQILVAGRGSEENLALAAVRLNAVRRALGAFLGERPTNDETVTPLYSGLR